MARWCTRDTPAKRTFTPISRISNEFIEAEGRTRCAAQQFPALRRSRGRHGSAQRFTIKASSAFDRNRIRHGRHIAQYRRIGGIEQRDSNPAAQAIRATEPLNDHPEGMSVSVVAGPRNQDTFPKMLKKAAQRERPFSFPKRHDVARPQPHLRATRWREPGR